MLEGTNRYKIELKIIAEDMAQLYEHTDKIRNKEGKILVDVDFAITEKQVDLIMTRRVREILNKYQIDYTDEELEDIVNYTKKDAVKKINRYRDEKGIKPFEANEIEK